MPDRAEFIIPSFPRCPRTARIHITGAGWALYERERARYRIGNAPAAASTGGNSTEQVNLKAYVSTDVAASRVAANLTITDGPAPPTVGKQECGQKAGVLPSVGR